MQFVCAVCMQAMTHPVDNVPSQDLVLRGTAARGAAVGGLALLVVIPCFGKGCSRIHLDFASICIS